MAQPPPSLNRKSSAPWDRLRPVKQDPLEAMGFVSKGDNRLLDIKTQETFYNKIVARYMQFCTHHSKDLDTAFASLSLDQGPSSSSDPSRNPPVRPIPLSANGPASAPRDGPPLAPPPQHVRPGVAAPSSELSAILTALRKLREGLLATSRNAPSPVFSQRVHVFNIRVAILAFHPPSYHASLLHLLFVLHTPEYPLPRSELVEMTTYLILDFATRQNDISSAYALRYNSRAKFGYDSRITDELLRAFVNDDWVTFWRNRRKVDGYVRAILYWHEETLRRLSLKAIGRSYLACDVNWILDSATGGEWTWQQLVEVEDVGWIRDGDRIIIRKPKARVAN
ncbi:hypothetical protein B0A52_03343 [Exophiala mesophila]|uniref:CSN8/PSMD8/EIF3K domain-containing protein n=1 Tax=Exophiala mesophila TaxID=212818 RepID=A0A438NBL4_EXOME|nr:hypothetical protein B0A52_03343 [Exophiala mesophila]